ncbi:MAG: crossover junction endodeoxyribonuclease RuvC [Ilumatobacteraceae bacterium]|jgi:crossover junction endodeoxyribonuclease RuvC
MFASPGPILGIDPGLTRCGYAVLASTAAGEPEAVSLGVIRTSPDQDPAHRLALLQVEIESLLDEFSPSSVAIERVFFQVNVRTAMSVGQASGVVLAATARRGLPIEQYTPTQVKSAVTGYGNATKEQIQRMVQVRLRLSRPPSPADAADAAAIALCHAALAPMRRHVRQATGGRT